MGRPSACQTWVPPCTEYTVRYPCAASAAAQASERLPPAQIRMTACPASAIWKQADFSSSALATGLAPAAMPAVHSAGSRTSINSRPLRCSSWAWRGLTGIAVTGLLVPFDMADQALAFFLLAFGQHVLFALVGVVAVLEHEADRRADQLEALAEEVLEIAPVAVRQRAQAVAVHDEGRRVAVARVSGFQCGHMTAHHRRRKRGDREIDRLGHLGGGEAAGGAGVGLVDGLEQLGHAGAVLGRDGHDRRPGAERQLAVEQGF